MLIIKALTKVFEDWGEDESDFFVSYQVDIGLSEVEFSSDMFSFDVISPKRLEGILKSDVLRFGKGMILMNDFNQKEVEKKVNELLGFCEQLNEKDAYMNISKYLRWEMESFTLDG